MSYHFQNPVEVSVLSNFCLQVSVLRWPVKRECLFYMCLDTCCSHFLTIIASVDLHFRHESKLPVCQTCGLNPGRRGVRQG